MGKIRVKDDELRDAISGEAPDGSIMAEVVAELSNTLGVTLRCIRTDMPFYDPRRGGEARYNRFYNLQLDMPGGGHFDFPRVRNPNEIKRTVATIADLIHMGFIKLEECDVHEA